ncbi:50S ribosomal protein L29 [Tumidithrix helvetica PCC 7403]|uniref:Large ribosomal subunit protein uL29 n=1 Tax=Tumidithrix elongata BACA0141 TaxID=2716417 RepID=A0AAW9PYB8_9CYAN|nr:50S ribosomal protein L29 [Tumidithrix elongata RA019]
MALPKVQSARELSDEELQSQILSVKKELFTLRLKSATRQPVKPHEFGHAKHRLAQLMTVERERQSRA